MFFDPAQIVHIMRLHFTDVNLFKMALRALGNLSFCDQNIRYLVDSGAVECIVQGMKQNEKDAEALQNAVEVCVFASDRRP